MTLELAWYHGNAEHMRSLSIVFLASIALLLRNVRSAVEVNGTEAIALNDTRKAHWFPGPRKDFSGPSSLNVHETADEEERVLPLISKVKTIASKIKSLKLKALNHVFTSFQLKDPEFARKEALAVIERPELLRFFSNIRLPMIKFFTMRYGDKVLAQVLVMARKSGSKLTQQTAKWLSIQQLKRWEKQKKTVRDVFDLLTLNGPDKLLAISDGRIEVLHSYIKKLNSHSDPESIDAILIKTLRDGYGGDDKLAIVIGSGIKDPDYSTWEAAGELQQKYLTTLWEQNPSYENLFQMMKLNDGPNKYLAVSDGRIDLLDVYIKLKLGTELSDTALIQTLLKGYGGDEKFALVVGAALKDSDKFTRTAAFELGIKYCSTLETSGASYDDFFSKLKLNDGLVKYEAFTDGRINLLDGYIQFKSGDEASDHPLIQTLLKGYGGDEKFALLLSAAQKDAKDIQVAAQKLEAKYFNYLVSEKVTPVGLVTRLNAINEGPKIFGSWKLKVLERYTAFLSRLLNDPRMDLSMVTVLKDGFGGTDKLAILLMRAKRRKAWDVVSAANRYERELFSRLVAEGKTNLDNFMVNVFPNGFKNQKKYEKMAKEFRADFEQYILTQRG